jgi:hypothetical protein
MTPWTALLESLHSALIDELLVLHPKTKPVLGLPTRQKGFACPPGVTQVLRIPVEFRHQAHERSFGHVFLARRSEQVALEDLWNAMKNRAGAEFSRRQIQPLFSQPSLYRSELGWEPKVPLPGRTVWIPIDSYFGQIYFGIGAG